MAMCRKIGFGLVCAAMFATASMLVATEASAATNAHGTVQCTTGAKVVGVWVNAKNGGSDFAKFSPRHGRLSEVNFHLSLPRGGAYAVTVGCGGTSKRWKTSVKSNFVNSDKRYWFTCHDNPTPWYASWMVMHPGICQVT